MIKKWLLAQPDAARSPTSPAAVAKKYRYWRIRTLSTLFIGYAVFYFVRKNLSAATPAMITDLGLTKTQIGAIGSSLYLTYGIGKFVNGIIGDRANPRTFMAMGLVLSALMNIFFGLSSSFYTLGLFWALNGWFQSMGWPPCARSLTHWFSTEERGTYWGIWNASHQVGGAIILALAGWLTAQYGWRSSFYVPAVFSLGIALFILISLRDTPRSLGLPSIEEFHHTGAAPPSGELDTKELLFKQVLKRREIWLLAVGNFFVYVVRYGAMDWAPTFMVESKNSAIAFAALKVSGFEITGIFGALVAGFLSDRLFHGKRAPINVAYMLLLIVGLIVFWRVPAGHPVIDALALGIMGFAVYGPQMLVGVAAADLVSPKAAATATGFTGMGGYLGGIVSGVGAGWVLDHYGWDGGFIFFIVCAALGAVCFLFTGWSKRRG